MHKLFFNSVILVSTAVWLASAQAADNLVSNSSFEAQSVGTSVSLPPRTVDTLTFTDWRVFNAVPDNIPAMNAQIIPNATPGSTAIRLDIDSVGGGDGSYGLDRDNGKIPVSFGTHYLISFDAAYISGMDCDNLGFYIAEFDGSNLFLEKQTIVNFSVSDSDYKTYSIEWTPSDTSSTQANIAFAPLFKSSGNVALSITNVCFVVAKEPLSKQ